MIRGLMTKYQTRYNYYRAFRLEGIATILLADFYRFASIRITIFCKDMKIVERRGLPAYQIDRCFLVILQSMADSKNHILAIACAIAYSNGPEMVGA